MIKNQLDTPCLILHYSKMIQNIDRMLKANPDVVVRPHTKTHKIPEIAKIQLERGCKGITVAKIEEAEVMIDFGIEDILIAYPIIGEEKIARLFQLNKKVKIITCIDSMYGAMKLSDFAVRNNTIFEVLVMIDTGLKRCGISLDENAIRFVKNIDSLPGTKIRGLFSYDGHAEKKGLSNIKRLAQKAASNLVKFAEKMKSQGVRIEIISTGSTATAPYVSQVKGISEIRPGNYVFNDFDHVKLGTTDLENCALSVLTSAISKPCSKRVIIDAGSKSLSKESNVESTQYKGYGYVKKFSKAYINDVNEEHGFIMLTGNDSDITIGDKLEIIPNHVCVVVNLFDHIYVLNESEQVIAKWLIRARGRVR